MSEASDAALNALDQQVALIDGQGVICYVNAAWQAFGQAHRADDQPVQGVGANYLAVCERASASSPDAAQTLHGLRQVLSGERARFEISYPCEQADGRVHWFEMVATPCPATQGAVIIHVDITARQLALQASQASLRRLTHQLGKAREDEDRRLGMALHEDLAQQAAGLRMSLAATMQDAALPEPLQQRLQQLDAGLGELTHAIRRLSFELRPALLDDLGLAAALQALAESVEARPGLTVRVQGADFHAPTDQAATMAYRVAQAFLAWVQQTAPVDAPLNITLELAQGRGHLRLACRMSGPPWARPPLDPQAMAGVDALAAWVHLLGGQLAQPSGPGWAEWTLMLPRLPALA